MKHCFYQKGVIKILYDWVLLITGICLIFFSFLINTNNFQSTLMFKIFPFSCGCWNIYTYLVLSNIITLNIK